MGRDFIRARRAGRGRDWIGGQVEQYGRNHGKKMATRRPSHGHATRWWTVPRMVGKASRRSVRGWQTYEVQLRHCDGPINGGDSAGRHTSGEPEVDFRDLMAHAIGVRHD